jgi:hypothetical protein
MSREYPTSLQIPTINPMDVTVFHRFSGESQAPWKYSAGFLKIHDRPYARS